jgi:hypothetical protein
MHAPSVGVGVLRCALEDAVEDRVLEANAMAGYTYSRKLPFDPEDEVDKPDPFSMEEHSDPWRVPHSGISQSHPVCALDWLADERVGRAELERCGLAPGCCARLQGPYAGC